MNSRNTLIVCLAFIGGFVIMSIELLGGRLLAPWFGSSIYVWGSVISVFMLALALGYYIGGRWSVHNPSLVRFGWVFIVGGVILLPLMLSAETVMETVFEQVSDPRFGSLLAASILFIAPTLTLGIISPYSVRLLVEQSHRAGEVAGRLYFFSTLGSAIGTLATSFYFVLWFEMQTIFIALCGTLIACGCAAFIGHKQWGRQLAPASAVAALCLLVLPLLSTPVDAATRVIHKERSLYRTVMVVQDSTRRCMQFSVRREQRNQSCKDRRDARRLVFDYAKLVFAGFLVNPEPKSILIVGLGGGTLPVTFRELLPTARIDVVEIDQAVVNVAEEYFDYKATPPGELYVQDARIFGKRAAARDTRYDLIVLDAFNGDYIPEHLMTREYLLETQKLLSQGGVLLANTFSISKLYHHESATYASVFGKLFNVTTPSSANRVVMAINGPEPTAVSIEQNINRWQSTLEKYGVDLAKVRTQMDSSRDWNQDARVLTDQYSPANLLQN